MPREEPTLKIPADLIEPAIEANVTAAIALAMGDKVDVMQKAIASVLATPVDENGRPSRYSSDRKRTWLNWCVEDAIKKATEAAVRQHVDQYREQLEETLVAELKRKNSPLAKQLVSHMMTGAMKTASYRWEFQRHFRGKVKLMSNLFEHELTCYVRSYKADKKQVEKDGPLQSTAHIGLRIIDPEDFEPVVATLRACSEEDAREWIEGLFGLQHGRLDGEFKDHKARFRAGRQLGTIDNCIVNAFDIDHDDLGITFKLLGYGVSKTLHGELCALVGEQVHVTITRAKHWQEQADALENGETEPAEQQEEIPA